MLLGIRTAPKEDLGCSSAEMVYGTPLTVPGDFIPNHSISDNNLQLQRLHDQVRSLVLVPTSQHGAVPTSVPRNLQQAKFVFIRRDAHRTPLQRPYEGPFKVIKPGSKTFQIDIGGKTETLSVDRLKPAHLATSSIRNAKTSWTTPKEPQTLTDTYHPTPNPRHPQCFTATAHPFRASIQDSTMVHLGSGGSGVAEEIYELH